MIEIERQQPNSFSKKDLDYCVKALNDTEHLYADDLWGEIGDLNQKMVNTYAGLYRNLLVLIRDTFDAIYAEIQENADQFLRFGGKR